MFVTLHLEMEMAGPMIGMRNHGGTVDPLKTDADREYLVGEGTVLNGSEIIAYYVKDENGDNIPDKYQRTVTFNVVNGAWNDGETAQKEIWVTLTDAEGNSG